MAEDGRMVHSRAHLVWIVALSALGLDLVRAILKKFGYSIPQFGGTTTT